MDTFISQFHFLRPLMFLLLLPLFWLFFRARAESAALSSWTKVVEPQLLAYLQAGKQAAGGKNSSVIFLLAGLLAVTALAGPVWKKMPQPVYSDHSAVVVALDLSRSMDAADIKPSRLTRAKQKLADLLHERKEGETALLVFAGSAFVVTPLTDDEETILSQLQGLTTDIMPVQGGNIDAALAEALRLFEQAGVRNGKVLLLTDSERYSQEAVAGLTGARHRLFVVGVGSKEGAPIAKPGGGFVTDSSGNIVVPQLDEQALRKLALMGSGSFHTMTLDNRDIEPVLGNDLSDRLQPQEDEKEGGQTSDEWVEEGPWLLLPVLLLLLPLFRRGLLVIALFIMAQPQDVRAWEWNDLWQTSDQQGESLMQDGKFAEAAEKFDDPAWKAAATYKEKDYSKALQQYNRLENRSTDDKYNMANTLAQLGKLDEAIALYDEVIKENPGHEDAKANKSLLEKMKQQQESQQKQSDKNDQKEGDKQDQSEQKQGDQSQQDQSRKGQDQQSQDQSDQSQSDQGQKGDSSQDQQDKQSSDGQQDKSQEELKQEQQQAQQAKQDDSAKDDKQAAQQQVSEQSKSPEETPEEIEAKQAFEQQLRRIPDDPGGLLRRKFKYQYQQQSDQRSRGAEEQW